MDNSRLLQLENNNHAIYCLSHLPSKFKKYKYMFLSNRSSEMHIKSELFRERP